MCVCVCVSIWLVMAKQDPFDVKGKGYGFQNREVMLCPCVCIYVVSVGSWILSWRPPVCYLLYSLICLFVYLKIHSCSNVSVFPNPCTFFSSWNPLEAFQRQSALASFLQRFWPVGWESSLCKLRHRQVKKRMGKGGGATQGAVGEGRIKGGGKRKKKREVRAL